MKTTIIAAVAALALTTAAQASEYDAQLRALAESQLKAIAENPILIAAIKEQNAAHAALSQGDIDALDTKWRAEAGQSPAPTIDPLLAKEASAYLAEQRDAAEGLITEAFAMDDKGLNVALSDVTSDYWQGDEAKWQETYQAGASAVHLGEVEFDESSQSYQAQVSLAIADPDTGAPIGAITFGVNAEMLE
ncbi:MAG: hypothetical protein AAFW46_08780 [Pseudomonadota bacterium]